MYKLCQTERSTARQRAMEQGLLRIMLQQRYEDITVSELCQKLGITRKIFYRYFSGKDGCLFALLDHTMMDFFTESGASFDEHSGTALGDLDRFFVFWYDHRSLLDALAKSSMSGLLTERATTLALRERLMPRYIQTWAVDLQRVAMSFAISGLIAMVSQWHAQGFLIDPGEMSRLATVMLTQPLIRLRQTDGG